MVKMVVTDMDGTLLDSQKKLPQGFDKVYSQLDERGIYFVVASGRQYYTLVKEFECFDHKLCFIAENGGFISWGGNCHMLKPLRPGRVKGLIEDIRIIQGADIVLCGKNGAYIESGNQRFVAEAKKYYCRCTLVDDLLNVEDDILKLAINDFENLEGSTLRMVLKYAKGFHVSTSSPVWLDIMPEGVNKGAALEFLQEKMGVSKSETMAFGDYLNDYEMLQMADYSYAMANAHGDIKKVARFMTKSNDDNGVVEVLDRLLEGM